MWFYGIIANSKPVRRDKYASNSCRRWVKRSKEYKRNY